MNIVLLLVSLIVAPFLIAKVDLWRKKHLHEVLSWWSEENMPNELRNATLFLCEEDVATTLPVPLHGRVDQVFLSKKKVLIPLDTKLRKDNRIFESDVIQLSVYRVILKNQFNLEVSDYGYVRTVVPQPDGKNKVRYIRTKLLNEKKVVSLYYKYQAIRQGLIKTSCSCEGLFH